MKNAALDKKAQKLLIVDDEALIRSSMREILEYEGYEIEEAPNGKIAFGMLQKENFDAVFCDIKMPEMDGEELLDKVRDIPSPPFIMISGHGDIDVAVSCIKKGAFDYISKPLDLNRVLVSLRNALENDRLVTQTRRLQKNVDDKYKMVGTSGPYGEAVEMADRVASTPARVLILGENGTGKELVARRIHALSQVSDGPFVEVNCAAIPSELIESELFGHEKGAFTSAIKQKKGSFEQAKNGTLFLDEIGDMSLSAQAKVLRALQENIIMRVGGEKPIEVNPRIIAATNKDIAKEIAEGRFREDLYHRLSVIILKIPPLREHKEDIPVLVEHFIKELSSKMGRSVPRMERSAMDILQTQSWPGNIRQLHNIIERLLILCPGKTISEQDVVKYL